MKDARQQGQFPDQSRKLDRSGFVPLYYQLQEALKEQIESGNWQPGEALPSEPELARRYCVSRVVVRQALAILEDDRQIVRVRGRGTFVAEPKLHMQAGGLTRLLLTPRPAQMSILVLDYGVASVGRSIRDRLTVGMSEDVFRMTTLLSFHDKPLAISYSFFRRSEVNWLERVVPVGRRIPPDLKPPMPDLKLSGPQVVVETSQCGQFEADHFGIPSRSAVFLVHCTEYLQSSTTPQAFEFARVEYRGDMVQLHAGPHPDPWSFSVATE
jgi:GntR family transcriptional regulator